MPVSYTSLFTGGFGTPWHSGNQNLTYSFLGSPPPSYYPRRDINSDGTDDRYQIRVASENFPELLVPLDANVGMSSTLRSLAERAVLAWNEVANVRMTPGASGGGGGATGAAITGNGTLVSGLGGAAGFGENTVTRNDDGSQSFSLSSIFESGLNFFGNNFSTVYVNTNGSISFGSGISQFTPSSISGGSTRIIAPFWADVDTRTDGVAPESAPIYVDFDTVNDVLTVTWANVGYYSVNADRLNSFQLQLFDRGSGNFDIVFRYQDIQWTAGDASGGSGGLGGTPARAGYSAGDQTNFFELPQSGNQAALLNLENTAGNTGVTGLWAFQVRNGAISAGDITFGSYAFGNPSLFGFAYAPGQIGTPSRPGDVWLNLSNAEVANSVYGDDGWQTFLHELGHALGLSHPNGNGNDGEYSNQTTVMSYNPHPSQANVSGQAQVFPVTPMILDIQAMQAMYGPNLATRNTANTYFGPALAGTTQAYALGAGGTIQFDQAGAGSGNGRVAMLTIWDAGGEDWLSASNQTTTARIDLRPGSYSTIGPIANNIGIATAVLVGGAVINYIEHALGGAAGDEIHGNDTLNIIRGGGGNDTIYGWAANDSLYGEDGNDGISGGAENDTVYAGAGNDLVQGDDGADVLIGDAGLDSLYGGAGADSMDGGADNDTLYGGLGDDFARGSAGADLLIGQDGADQLYGDDGNDSIDGGLGNDTAYGGLGADYMRGDVGNDVMVGQDGADRIDGDDGADSLDGGIGADTIYGGAGGDNLFGMEDADLLIGQSGADTIYGGLGDDAMDGGIDNDIVIGQEGIDQLYGDLGLDALDGGLDNDIIYAGGDADYARGSEGNDLIIAQDGDDRLDGDAGNDSMDGGLGADTLYGGDGADYMLGGDGADLLIGQIGADLMYGDAANDAMDGGADNDTLYGGLGNDYMLGDIGNDALIGQAGLDTIYGGDGGDTIDAGGDSDLVYGGAGADYIIAGTGADTIYGGSGADRFVFAAGSGADRVYDFEDGVDRIDLYSYVGATAGNTTLAQIGADTRITLIGGETILLLGITATNITAADFLFA